MRVFRLLTCFTQKHINKEISLGGVTYRLCLRCGKIERSDSESETARLRLIEQEDPVTMTSSSIPST